MGVGYYHYSELSSVPYLGAFALQSVLRNESGLKTNHQVTATTALPGPESFQGARGFFDDSSNLNTPVTTSSDVNFNFVGSEFEISQEAFPITGESPYTCIIS